jgi:hypothetical protein
MAQKKKDTQQKIRVLARAWAVRPQFLQELAPCTSTKKHVKASTLARGVDKKTPMGKWLRKVNRDVATQFGQVWDENTYVCFK